MAGGSLGSLVTSRQGDRVCVPGQVEVEHGAGSTRGARSVQAASTLNPSVKFSSFQVLLVLLVLLVPLNSTGHQRLSELLWSRCPPPRPAPAFSWYKKRPRRDQRESAGKCLPCTRLDPQHRRERCPRTNPGISAEHSRDPREKALSGVFLPHCWPHRSGGESAARGCPRLAWPHVPLSFFLVY